MTQQLLTIEQYERYQHYKRLQEDAERTVNFLWKLKQPLWTSYNANERYAIDQALEKAEHQAYFFSKKASNALKYSNIQKYNSAKSA